MLNTWWTLLGAVAILAGFLYVWKPMRAASRRARLARARGSFRVQRERLEAKFVQLATANAQRLRKTVPHSLHWDDCDFDDDVAYVRDRHSGELSAFVKVTVAVDDRTNPTTGIDSLIGNLRAATAIFRFDRDHWETDGRAILNLSPDEAIRFYRNDLEMVEQERLDG